MAEVRDVPKHRGGARLACTEHARQVNRDRGIIAARKRPVSRLAMSEPCQLFTIRKRQRYNTPVRVARRPRTSTGRDCNRSITVWTSSVGAWDSRQPSPALLPVCSPSRAGESALRLREAGIPLRRAAGRHVSRLSPTPARSEADSPPRTADTRSLSGIRRERPAAFLPSGRRSPTGAGCVATSRSLNQPAAAALVSR